MLEGKDYYSQVKEYGLWELDAVPSHTDSHKGPFTLNFIVNAVVSLAKSLRLNCLDFLIN